MQELFTQFVKDYNAYMQSMFGDNHFVIAAVTVYLIGMATLCYKIWPRLINLFIRRYTSSINLVWDAMSDNREIYQKFCEWYSLNVPLRRQRNFSVIISNSTTNTLTDVNSIANTGEGDCVASEETPAIAVRKATRYALTAGYGFHWFMFKGSFFWFVKSKDSNSNPAALEKETIVLRTLGGLSKIQNLLSAIEPVPKPVAERKLQIFKLDRQAYYQQVATLNPVPLDSVYLNDGVQRQLIELIEKFSKNREWYIKNGLPHKLVICLRGEPGNGKTSITRALASHFKRDIYSIDLTALDNTNIAEAFRANRDSSAIFAIEDIDSVSAVLTRDKGLNKEISSVDFAGDKKLTLSGILNHFDGIAPLDNALVIISTNKYEDLDPAFVRKGRIDVSIELTKLQPNVVRKFIFDKYGKDCDESNFKPIAGCNLSAIWRDNLDDFNAFYKELTKFFKEN